MLSGYKDGSRLVFSKGLEHAVYDLKNGECSIKRGGNTRKVKDLKNFFRGLEEKDVIESFPKKEYQDFLRFISNAERRCTNVGTFLERLPRYDVIENYFLLGIKINGETAYKPYNADEYRIGREPTSLYSKDFIKFMAESGHRFSHSVQSNYKQDKELLDNIARHLRTKYSNEFTLFNTFASWLDSYYYSLDKFKKLLNNFNYEYKTLIDMLVFYGRGEGIELSQAISYLLDYADMQKKLHQKIIYKDGVIVRDDEGKAKFIQRKFEKYPKYLRSIHDIVQKNYRTIQEQVDEDLFSALMNPELEYKFGYMVVVPKTSDEVKREGSELHHCVASYLPRIMAGETMIVFMREVEDESLITLEIIDKQIRQARGLHNRAPSTKEREFIERYAKAKELTVAI